MFTRWYWNCVFVWRDHRRCGPFGVGEDPDRSVQFAVLPPPPRSCLEDASGAASSQSPLRLSPGAPATDLLNVTALQLSEAGNVDLLRQMASNNGMSTAYSERLSPPVRRCLPVCLRVNPRDNQCVEPVPQNLEMAYPGSLMNKLEALVNFFQVYAMIILLTWTTLWPDTWRDVKSVYDWPAKLLTLDLVGAFAPVRIHLSPAAQSYTRFAVLMCLPLVLLAAYLKVKSLDPSLW